jgi:hypothetical protein
MKLMFTFQSRENAQYTYWANVIRDDDLNIANRPSFFWFGDADNDVDGSPYWSKDPAGQPGTRWTLHGAPINGDIFPFIVVPPQIIKVTDEIVGCCQGEVTYQGIVVPCVVGDSGPFSKIGELSPAALRGLGLPAPQNGNGGLDRQEILYRIWPGVPANVNGIQFELQHS